MVQITAAKTEIVKISHVWNMLIFITFMQLLYTGC